MRLTTWIFTGMVLGIIVGYMCHELLPTPESAKVTAGYISLFTDIFLRLIKMIIAPLVFATLVAGVAGAGDLKAMGRIGLKAIVYFEVATTIALVIGLGLVNVFKPAANLAIHAADTAAVAAIARNQQSGWEMVLHLFPTSVVDAMARGDILQVVVFSLFFGVALAAMGPSGRPVLTVVESIAQVMFKVTSYVMVFAPVGVFAAVASTVGERGLTILLSLGKLIALMYAGLILFVLIVVVGVSYLIGVPFWRFAKAIREPFLIALTTASSEAALPKALEVMEQFGVPKPIVAFVLPLGYTFNLDGTTLYLSLASVFVAQLAGMSMTVEQQIVMMLTLMLASKGVAGVPRGALVVLAATLTQFGLPLEGAAMLLGIDQIMDMGRTAVNVMGNCIAAAVVARWEGVLQPEALRRTA